MYTPWDHGKSQIELSEMFLDALTKSQLIKNGTDRITGVYYE